MALTTGTLLSRGFRRRCPVCAHKKLFQRWISMAPECPNCGLRFERVAGQWLGSWFLNVCLSQVLAIGILIGGVVASYPAPPSTVLFVLGFLAMFAFPIWFFPYSRTIWLAIDLAMRPLEFDEGVAPGFELEAELHEETSGR